VEVLLCANMINVISCWKVDGNGIMVIKKSKQKEWKERITVLKDQIHYFINNPIEKMVEIIELFY